MNYQTLYTEWLNNDYFDEATRQELLAIKGNEPEIEDRFYTDLEFGTGGLRGILGAGTNRMNIYTVRKATQGLANYILKTAGEAGKKKGVAIAHDSRRMSPEFCREAALVLNANGIASYIFNGVRTTPELSFAVRNQGCAAGIVITASHNPSNYNGYKVYGEDGAQVTYPRDKEIIDEVNKITDFSMIKYQPTPGELYHVFGEQEDTDYINAIKTQTLDPAVIAAEKDKLAIVYTPLHGTGGRPVLRVLKELGYQKVYPVAEQIEPNGEFPTISYPNPEEEKAFEYAKRLGQEKNADLLLATDPDSDRLGIMAKTEDGSYFRFTGNMIAPLLFDYILTKKKEQGTLPASGALIYSFVSTKIAKKMAEREHLKVFEVLTGFKYIGEKIKEFEQEHSYEYLFGFEESYGYLIGTHARDKDAVVSAMLVCEMAAYYKTKGLNLKQALEALYSRYGYYREATLPLSFPGAEGRNKMAELLARFRQNPPQEIDGRKVLEIRDYESGQITDCQTGQTRPTGLVKSDVLYYVLSGDAWVCVRPSGTEPKMKLYYGVQATSWDAAEAAGQKLEAALMQMVK